MRNAPPVGGIFFPRRESWQLDQRQYSPRIREKLICCAVSSPSFEQATNQLQLIADISISSSNLHELANQVGNELLWERDQAAQAYQNAPLPRQHQPPQTPVELACVQVDGGRLQTRSDSSGQGVEDPAWREDKVAVVLRMQSTSFEEDPHPQLPRCFTEKKSVKRLMASLHGEPLLEEEPTEPPEEEPSSRWQPRPLVRTCVATLKNSDEFGKLVVSEVEQRGFYHAIAKAFVGDGQKYNWTIHKRHFKTFVPIVDFVHVVEHIYDGVKAGWCETSRWEVYLRLASACWQGNAVAVVEEFRQKLRELQKTSTQDPEAGDRQERLRKVIGYLSNNLSRMKYPEYRKAGLPTTSSLVESQIKQVNRRMKGTEKFWKPSEKGEAMIQLTSAWLSEDNRLLNYLRNRPGNPFHRSYPNYQLAN